MFTVQALFIFASFILAKMAGSIVTLFGAAADFGFALALNFSRTAGSIFILFTCCPFSLFVSLSSFCFLNLSNVALSIFTFGGSCFFVGVGFFIAVTLGFEGVTGFAIVAGLGAIFEGAVIAVGFAGPDEGTLDRFFAVNGIGFDGVFVFAVALLTGWTTAFGFELGIVEMVDGAEG